MILPTPPFRRGKTVRKKLAYVLLIGGALLVIGVMLLALWFFGGAK